MFNDPILFGPVMNPDRANVNAITTANTLVVREHHLKLTIKSFRIRAPGAAKITALKENQRANAISIIY